MEKRDLRIKAVKKTEEKQEEVLNPDIKKKEKKTVPFEEASEKAEVAKVAAMLDTNDRGVPLSSMYNVAYIVRNDPKLKGKIRYNSFAQALEPRPGIHWRGTWDETITHELWRDDDTAALHVYMRTTYKVTNKSAPEDTVTAVGKQNSYQPVRHDPNR